MKIHGHFICWNEEKIIPYFLRHYEQFCDKIVIWDNHSTDKSIELLSQSSRVEIRYFDTNETSDEDVEIYVKSTGWGISAGVADWVIIGDMDEFVYHPNIFDKLAHLDSQNISAVQMTAYQMVSLNWPSTFGQIYEEVNRGARLPLYDKTQLLNINKLRRLEYAPGCHEAYVDTAGYIQKSSDIKLLHFKLMGARATHERYKLLDKRRCQNDVIQKYGIQYEKSLQEIEKDITELWNQSNLVI